MRTNRTFAANCAATQASARSNFGGACHMKKICGSTRRGLAGEALATTHYIPLLLTLDLDSRMLSGIVDLHRVLHHVDTVVIEGKSYRTKGEIAE